MTMPAEKGVGFEDEQRLFPVLDATGEEDEPKAIGLRKSRFFDLAEDDEVLPKKCVLGDEIGFAV